MAPQGQPSFFSCTPSPTLVTGDTPVPADVRVDNIAKFQNWDKRECAVGNADEWKSAIDTYLNKSIYAKNKEIPKLIHQIWIGPKASPCMWLDYWRLDYLTKYPGWNYMLWTDDSVKNLQMMNRDLYDVEKMYQCKADLLRLEVLYEFGGVYIDADMVSLGKDIWPEIEKAGHTKFMISYEPDTKDKAYSVIGNSIIAVTPRHPLILMLMKYIRAIYAHKRPYHGVEWVTGPLAFTKALVHTGMQDKYMTVPPTFAFYPAFHFVPNPDSIDLSRFPNSYAFQFGYTCSGLAGYVERNVRCRRAIQCPVHSKKTDWEFGKFVKFPEGIFDDSAVKKSQMEAVPPTIHQIYLGPAGASGRPDRWTSTWSNAFRLRYPDYKYKLWSLDELVSREYFCVSMYTHSKRMDPLAVSLLAMEILYKEGGIYIPLDVMYHPATTESSPPAFVDRRQGFEIEGGIITSPKNNLMCAKVIYDLYNGSAPSKITESGTSVKPVMPEDNKALVSGGYGDSVAAYLEYPTWSRFLGVGMIVSAMANGNLPTASDETLILWAYDSNVPCFKFPTLADCKAALIQYAPRCLVLTDPECGRFRELRDQCPSFLTEMDHRDPNWHAIVLCVEYETGERSFSTYRASLPLRAPQGKYIGVIFNTLAAKNILTTYNVEKWSNEAFIDAALNRQHDMNIYVGVQKLVHNRALSELFTGMHVIQYAFERIANHSCPMVDIGSHPGNQLELHGNLLKVFRDESRNQICMELMSDGNGRVNYRAWNEDGGMNSECKLSMGARSNTIEFIRVYFAHQVVFEASNKAI
eukprot:CAMPEP_0184695982 /NCGR_PEP_ID=MMETSP0313-20130426/3425_1 /TAXON_ID=2792 /ORGANISM="Porphyridium aerugineum, Strain SAG 1380-2" /LENGTH=802 /DNA_ID=CAMNT_0027154521 /DNA_START=114 /DNA_END=2522 /DNA_ORIENTATION=-